MVLALTGEKLAGKGTAAKYLLTKHPGKVFRCSQILTDILSRLRQPNTRANLVLLGQTVRQLYGDHILAEVIKHDIEPHNARLCVIDGLRYQTEYEVFKTLPDFKLIYITAPASVRYQRSQHRQEKIDEADMSEAEFLTREQDVTEREIASLAAVADATIHNAKGLTEYYQELEKMYAILAA